MSFTPTDEQIAIINTTDSALVNAGPGTGKTRTAIEKALVAVREYDKVSHQRVLFLSFSNAAVFRLSHCNEIAFSRSEKRHLRFATYHACALDILRNYGRFIGLPPRIKVMDKLEERMIGLERDILSSDDDYLQKLYQIAKTEGLIAFEIIIPLATRLLQISREIKRIYERRYSLIIVDEFQDTSKDHWRFLKELGNDSQIIAFGDLNQIIYESSYEATLERFDEFKEWKNTSDFAFSVDNFRCNRPEILNFANALLKGNAYKTKDDNQVQLIKLANRHQLRSNIALIWRNLKQQMSDNQRIGIFAPSIGISEQVAMSLRNPPVGARLGFRVYAHIPKDEVAFDSIILAIAALRDYSLRKDEESRRKAVLALYAMEFAWNYKRKKIPSPIGLLKILEKSISTNSGLFSNLLKECQKFDRLHDLIPEFLDTIKQIKEFKTTAQRVIAHGKISSETISNVSPQLSLFDKLRVNRHPRGLEGYNIQSHETQILNYHKKNGHEFDFVIMIVDQ